MTNPIIILKKRSVSPTLLLIISPIGFLFIVSDKLLLNIKINLIFSHI